MLEIGPGINCGFAILLACYGAKPIVVDPYPVKWDERYHLPFFQLLRSELDGRPGVDLGPIDQLIEANDFDSRVIQRFDCPVELLDLEDDSIDVVCSNAVGEHFYDVDEAFRQLYRVTKPGGYGFHQVDFGDHRDFTRPLEYLLMSEAEFQQEFGLHRGEIGNRVRAAEMSRSITSSGLEIVNFDPNRFVDAEYLADFLPRLRSCSESPYREIAEEQLRILAGRYITRKV